MKRKLYKNECTSFHDEMIKEITEAPTNKSKFAFHNNIIKYSKLIVSDDLDKQIESLSFFCSTLRNYEIEIDSAVFLRIVDICNFKNNLTYIKGLETIKLLLSFNSKMLNKEIKNKVVDLALSDFPTKLTFGILINLALYDTDAQFLICKKGILNNVIEMISNGSEFLLECVNLANNLVYQIQDTDFITREFEDAFINIMDLLIILLQNTSDEKLHAMIFYYFLNSISGNKLGVHFINNNILNIMINIKILNNEMIEIIINVAKEIVDNFENGPDYILSNDFLSWVEQYFDNISLVESIFTFLAHLNYTVKDISDFFVRKSYHKYALQYFNDSNFKFSLRKAAMELLIEMITNSSTESFEILIHDDCYNILFENTDFITGNEEYYFVKAIGRIIELNDRKEYEYLFDMMRTNENFVEWLKNLEFSNDRELSNLVWLISNFLFYK